MTKYKVRIEKLLDNILTNSEEELARNGKISLSNIEAIQVLTQIVKDLTKKK